MNTIRNISLIILGLIVSFVISHYGVALAALIFVPPFLVWFALWDEKKYRQSIRKFYPYNQKPRDTYHQYK
ncbi:hypothetical protein JZO76_03385 [Enterococcus sp. MJM12]|uniref:Uncharacterized protein n=1 Tax=Candidatus Enterococcus myersii TaxID=2815322 RepID=A0ABS3H539_9ENTE|nr:hypothetical protein [Enterococcus sp. MJM12]MBO0448571.1 hypothetical protein [Enterococcus sp. MJM12]